MKRKWLRFVCLRIDRKQIIVREHRFREENLFLHHRLYTNNKRRIITIWKRASNLGNMYRWEARKSSRGIEIKGWLEQHKGISNYVIIDDMEYTLPEQQYHLILTDPNVGITKWDMMKAIVILNADPKWVIGTIRYS